VKTCVFVGPSAGHVVLPLGVDRFAPAALGAIWRAVELGYERIALVDGLFGCVPSVWHKEILYALSHGVTVLGASSMGALRAAELAPYGMIGVGAIFRFYRANLLSDDDEVCLLHQPLERGFQPLSLAMVSIRRTLASMARAGDIARPAAEASCRAMKRRHFSQRTSDALREVFRDNAPQPDLALAAFQRRYVDLKVRDYQRLESALSGPPATSPNPPPWQLLETHKWYTQFVEQVCDIPLLEPW
jgi:hypothetical protein